MDFQIRIHIYGEYIHSHTNFVIIDDTKQHISSEFYQNYVQTDSNIGITDHDLHKVHHILNKF